MKTKYTRSRVASAALVAVVCALLILPGDTALCAMQGPQVPAAAGQDAKIPDAQLDSLVAPIALYPDPLLSQTLVASTYPLEIVQLQQFLELNKALKDQALTDAVMKQDWDPSIQAMAAFPDVVKLLADNIRWTNDLGNAFLAQQNDVMNAVQRMRTKAVEKGAFKTTEQQKVETRVVEEKTVVVVEQTNPEVAYVPYYDPFSIWGSPYYPYPPVAYPPYYPTGGRLFAFGMGVWIGNNWGHGGWCCNAGWGNNNFVHVNPQNNFVNNFNRNNVGNRYGGNNNNWQHNPQHRGGAPYGNRATANRFGGTTRGEGMAGRQAAARQGAGQFGGSQFRGTTTPSFSGGQGLNRGPGGGGGDRIGNRQVSNGNMGSRNSSALSGGGDRKATRASSSRGYSSMGSRGGGMSRGGGGRGGGGRRR